MGEEDSVMAFLTAAENYDPSDVKAFAALVSRARQLTEISLSELAQVLSTGAGTVSRWEHGHAAPPIVGRTAIAKRLADLVRRRLTVAVCDRTF